jgi:hypothetical protein
MRHAEHAARALREIAALLVADRHNGLAVVAGQQGDQRLVVGERAVAAQLEGVGEEALGVIDRVRAVGIARQLDGVPDVGLLGTPLEALAQAADLIRRPENKGNG